MKAIVSAAAGGPETLVLTELPDPTPNSHEVVLRVRACGINYPDVLIIEDKYQFRPSRPFAPGSEVAGEVIAVGDGVTNLAVTDRVIGITTHGGLAEKIALPSSACTVMPKGMPWDVAAGLIFTYGTAQHALHDRASLKTGETLLVLGAAGGVGLAAVQLGKAAGAIVIAAVSSQEKAAVASKAGADRTLVYPSGPIDRDGSRALTEQFKAAVGATGADVVCDAVGGAYAEPALRAIAWNGRYLVIGFPAGIPKIGANLILLKSCQLVGVFWGAFSQREPARNRANTQMLFELWQRGKIEPQILARYPLADGARAISDLAERRSAGKVVVEIS
jgi:NADPH2:quinone reductase